MLNKLFTLALSSLLLWSAVSSHAAAQQPAASDDSFIKHRESATEKQPPGRTRYLSRQIAATMHWVHADWLTRTEREREEAATEMRRQLRLKPGQHVCDFGAGNGYHTLPMAQAVGPRGKAYAVDIQIQMLRLLHKRAVEAKVDNIEYILGTLSDPKLPANTLDLVLMVDVYHELSHPVYTLNVVRKSLKPGGRLVLVEYRAEDKTVPIRPLHKMSKPQVVKEMTANGFRLVRQFDALPWQHMMFFERADADWPQWLGPTRDGVYQGPALAGSWPKDGPPVVWKRKVGVGFSGPVVAGDRLILFHRVDDHDVVECLDARTQKRHWTYRYATQYSDDLGKGDGPRSTPTVADGRVFTYGAQGMLHALDLESGKKLWTVDMVKQFHSRKGFFGRDCSPLVVGDRVLLNIGGAEAGVGAFDVKTGELQWKATDHEAGYASPTAAMIGDRQVALFFTRTGLVATDPAKGDILFQQRWRSRQHASVNAATPLVVGDVIFLTSSYQTGAIALKVTDKSVTTIWSGNESLSSQYVTPVYRDGYLYGFDGRHDFGDTKLRCVELKTGKVMWTNPDMPGGPIILAGDKLLILTERGRLVLADASPKGYHQVAAADIMSGAVRAHPALAGGMLYARDDRQLICIDLRAK